MPLKNCLYKEQILLESGPFLQHDLANKFLLLSVKTAEGLTEPQTGHYS